MRSLSQIILLLTLSAGMYAQSPHGKDLNMACSDCHNPKGWKLETGTYTFTHDNTQFPLLGSHEDVNCKLCHPTLVFSEAKSECVSCHTDMHYQTVGMECERCHTPKSWLVENINEIHRQSRFPLVGPHMTADCYSCHPSASLLRFEPLGVECYDCHQQDYQTATSPNHVQGNYSTECLDCHKMNSFTWSGSGVDHSFFPLTEGHALNDCNACHTGNDYSNISPDCITCHQKDYNATTNPNHFAADISTNCAECHTTQPDWKPANFQLHDAQYFPVYSGKHKGTWDNCIDCHTNPNNYATNSCIICHDHNQADMDDEHDDVGGYIYSDPACFECHPTGEADDNSFNHNNSNFPLTGAHITTECLECHYAGYAGTTTICEDCHIDEYNQSTNPNHVAAGISNDCAACHTTAPDWAPASFAVHNDYYLLSGAHATIAGDCFTCHAGDYNNTPNICFGCHANNYNQTTNPNHLAIGISNDCETCHTTNPEWKPATFPTHNSYYALIGAHATIAADCFTCHNGNYNNTPNTCYACHIADYNQTNNPNHLTAQFPTDCETCHTQNAWTPSTFNHDGLYFPIYSGEHNNEWDQCSDCHTNPGNFAIFTCFPCHPQGEMDDEHDDVPGYQYNSDACLACHPDGSANGAFNHNATNFPLTGAHTSVECSLCHTNGYSGTTTICGDCHNIDYNQSTNPNHNAIGISNDCIICHTTAPGWEPATFPVHNNYYLLTGAHATISGDCFSCHAGDYNNTPNICSGCHTDSYNQSTNPNHLALGISNDCETCHTTNPDWQPATFPTHNNYYALIGAHATIATDCFTCHNGNYNNTPNTCYGCHATDYNQTTDPDHQTAQFPTDCETCHTQTAWEPSTFNHDGQYFPIYSGEHNGEWAHCSDCHTNPGNFAIFTCFPCHPQGEMDDEHDDVPGYQYNSDACLACHPDGSASGAFNHSSTNFPLTGAHTSVECSLCHMNGYSGTTTICGDCHNIDYNQSTNPNHTALGISNDCAICHTTAAGWEPATFPVHNNYYLLTGAHATISGDCFSCHAGNYNNTPNVCSGCHTDSYNQSTNPNHPALGISNDCGTCHTTNPDWQPATFPTHNNYYALIGAHATIATDCFTCHNGNYNTTPNTCFGCHSSDYNQTNDPPHQSAQFPTDCEACHTQAAWEPSTFNHDGQYFPIYSGEHNGEWDQCNDCHTNPGNFAIFTCLPCHPQGETNSEHQGVSGYQYNSDACLACHPDGSEAGAINHNATNFPLTGAHTTVECNLCHVNGYTGTSTICGDCHGVDFNQSTNPNHTALSISNDCAICHTTAPGWEPATFPVHNNYYLLTGAHAAISGDCFSCHAGNYNNTPNVCSGCHTDSYNQSTNPNHNAIGISTDCSSCHTTAPGWEPATFPVHNNYYLLSGAHAVISGDCFSCHNGDYNNTPNVCSGCHTSNYNQTTNPNHTALGISNDCATCHTTNPDWQPATFPTHNNYYALIGAHATIATDCFTCHNGNYNTTPNTCFGCHAADYNQTNDPPHQTAQFPTDCETCHTQAAWEPSTFNHDGQYFPIYSGEHNGEWNQCSDCHTNAGNFSIFTCFTCHNQGEMNSEHQGISGYSYNSDACLACHPDGSGSGAFNHSVTNFPLTGAHTTVDCNLCHVNGYNGTTTICGNCHGSDYNQSTNPNHTAIGISNDCATCHTTAPNWQPATFPTHNNYYVLMGAHITIATDCFICHNGNYNNTPNTCYGCHTSDYNQTNDPPHQSAQFPTDCEMCHTQSVWDPSTFNHDGQYFPIYSGKHNNKWDFCSDCHTNAGNYSIFTCLTCHTQQQTNNKHNGVNGYQYNSIACLACHPDGEEKNIKMNKEF